MTLKHLVFALAVAAASAVAPFPRGSTEAVGDTFEMGKAVAKNDATLAVDVTPKLRGGAEGMAFRPAGRGLDFGHTLTDEPTAEPTGKPTAAPTVTPNTDVGGPAAAACLALEDGTCEKCCGGCTRKTPTSPGGDCVDYSGLGDCVDFGGVDECICFEGDISGESFYYDYADSGIRFESVVLTSKNDCAKVDGDYVKIYARARRQSTRTSRFLADGGVPRRAGGATTRLLSTATSTNSGFAPASALPAALDLGFYRRATRATTCCTRPATATGFTCAPRPPSPGTAPDLVSFRRAAAALTR